MTTLSEQERDLLTDARHWAEVHHSKYDYLPQCIAIIDRLSSPAPEARSQAEAEVAEIEKRHSDWNERPNNAWTDELFHKELNAAHRDRATLLRLLRSRAPEPVMECTGCGSTQSIEEIKAHFPQAISCCPERKMALRSRAPWVDRDGLLDFVAEYMLDHAGIICPEFVDALIASGILKAMPSEEEIVDAMRGHLRLSTFEGSPCMEGLNESSLAILALSDAKGEK